MCKEMFLRGDVKKCQTFLKSFIKKIDLTRDTCKVRYDLARLLTSQQDGSTLRVGLVVPTGVEPVLPT